MQFASGFVILASKFIQVSFGKEIYTLLLQHDIVIIPGLGAFVSEYRPAEISDDSDEIKPPSKTVSFNPLLKNNDGLVVGHIAQKLHISHLEALVRIEKEREDILFKLDKGDKVELEGVGILSYNEQGKIDFQPSEEENILLDSFGLEPTTIKDPEPIQVPEEEPAAEEAEEPTPVTEPEENEPEEEKVEIQETPQIEVPVEKENIPVPEEKQPEPAKPPVEDKEKKKKKSWLFLLILIPIIAVAAFILVKGYYNNQPNAEIPSKTTITEDLPTTPEPAVIDSVAADSLAENVQDTTLAADSIQSKPEVEESIEQGQDSIRYYLVGGSFSVQENADTYLSELKEKGYDAFHVGKKGRFYIVGISSHKTFSEADTAKVKYMEDNPGSEVWVYRK